MTGRMTKVEVAVAGGVDGSTVNPMVRAIGAGRTVAMGRGNRNSAKTPRTANADRPKGGVRFQVALGGPHITLTHFLTPSKRLETPTRSSP